MSEVNKIENSGENLGTIAGCINGDVYNNCTINNPIRKVPPSIINKLIEQLAEISADCEDEHIGEPFEIDEKITYNNLIVYKYVLDEIYASAWYNCESAIRILDNNKYGSKNKVLQRVNTSYLQAKGEIIAQYRQSNKSDIEIIRENADTLIKMVADELEQHILRAYRDEQIFDEDIMIGIIYIVCYAFGECKILEKPRCDENVD